MSDGPQRSAADDLQLSVETGRSQDQNSSVLRSFSANVIKPFQSTNDSLIKVCFVS